MKELGVNNISNFDDNFNGEGMKLIPSSITHLLIRNCYQIKDDDLKHLPPNLIELEIKNCEFSGIGFQYLPLSLKKLEIDGNCLTDEGMKVLHNITTIQFLDLQYNRILTNDGIKYLPLSLTSLIFKNNLKITSECLLSLPSNLIKLEINESNSEIESSEILSRIPSSIKDLKLCYFNINKGEIKYLHSNIQKLQFLQCKVDEESMKSLPKGKF